ncbi:secondary thiamine-phosphate synthase enzyme [Candidatus Nitrosoglobus terrae]|uniref:Secondary thiamine-phosphate synthase enzyme n=1 Tax=Candidatus Nitrosoglobus terrae TaxID=1630141 RepID=A0A1Q2SMG5_9GAMM|nr:secondary thiamine-phosphate synthase enzyme YjbQ [Candidatus Nitrosoglobus terrae]BAW80326.1 secondary thiamine-phosphate synthase enzyme [Candidatus Nitrosoglobus terrae]
MVVQERLEITTRNREMIEITAQVQGIVAASGIKTGLCHLFIHHTSASLILCENADPDVQRDLAAYLNRLVPDGDPLFIHTQEGVDDMAAHVRTVLTHSDLSLPVADSCCSLGTWQGIYIWEHRYLGHRRRVTVTIYGE